MSKYAGKIVTNQAPAGYSVYFDGSGDTLSIANNAALNVGSGDFCIEAWFNVSSVASQQIIVSNAGAFGSDNTQIDIASGNIRFASSATVWLTGNAVTTNVWNHVAVSRSGTTMSLFLNGSRQATATNSTNFANANNYSFAVGAAPGYAAQLTGYVSNIRVVKGSSVYDPTQTSIRVPTQLLRITNTSLLTCNSPAIIDQSSNAFAITVNGNAAVSTVTPFTAYVPYNPALGASTPGVWTLDEAMQARATRQWNMYDPYFNSTTLLLHGNGTNGAQNNTFLDSSSNNFTITRNGNTTQGSFSPFSQVPGAWSNFFNGSSYLTTASNAAFQFGTGDFTMECWINMAAGTSLTGYWRSFLSCAGDSASVNGVTLYIADAASGSSVAGEVAAIIGDNTIRIYGGQDIRGLGWVHVALTRSGTTLRLFVNGVQRTSATNSSNITGTSYGAQIGLGILAQNNYFIGYVSNVRVVKGTALYTADFTPSVAPLTAVVNTSLLTCQSNRFVDNSSNNFTITPTGTPSVQAFSPFYPVTAYTPATVGGSGYFDGTGDYLNLGGQSEFAFGSGNFTIEMWVYFVTLPASGVGDFDNLIDFRPVGVNGLYPTIYLDGTAKTLRYLTNSADQITGSTTIVASTWYHIALTRSGTSTKLFLNGTQEGSTYTDSNTYLNGTSRPMIATNGYNTSLGQMNGYMTDLRILKGTAQYTSTFTPPTAPLTAITNTQLLLNFTNAGIIDSTAKNVLETVGNAQISTTQSKFGGSSMYFDGTGDYLTSISKPMFAFGSGDFTIEFWFYIGSTSTGQIFIDFRTSATQVVPTLYIETNTITYFVNGSARINVSFSTTNTWTHLALSRQGTSTKLFVNGTQGGSTYTDSNNYIQSPVYVGARFDAAAPLNGYIDDLRITTGVARYTANFTPQTSQWQDQ